MKKSPLMLALLGALACGSAAAQSNVILFGAVDAAYARVSHGGSHVSALSNSGNSYSRLGVRGTEDLGGGLTAGFWLEGQLYNDVGQGAGPTTGLNFQRRATVSLAGRLGELRLGRDNAATYLNPAWFDPFQGAGIGQPSAYSMLGAPIRVGNAIAYFLPGGLGGLYGMLQYAPGEEPSSSVNAKNATYGAARLGYADKALNVAAATGKLHTGGASTVGHVKASNVAVSYNFGPITPMAFWAQEKTHTGARIDAWLLGATMPLGSGELRAAYSRYDRKNSADDWNKLSLGYVHHLSKRTALYGTYAHIKNKGASAQLVTNNGVANWPIASPLTARPGAASSGVEFGIRHNF